MKLKLLNFVENQGQKNEWQYENFALRELNLVVGVNASGKSRTLRSIDILACLLSKRANLLTCPDLTWKAVFEGENNEEYTYELEIKNLTVINERFADSKTVLLSRPAGEVGTIRMESNGSAEMMAFKLPDGELAAPNKMDLLQTPFLEPLIRWGESVFYYRFGSTLGQEALGLKGLNHVTIDQIEHDQNAVLPKFAIAIKTYPEEFLKSLMDDMKRMGYPLEEASLSQPSSIISGPAGLVGLSVKEANLSATTEQLTMSQGMFRAYSILIHANYLTISKKCGCLLIDDIGEGLDFGRSCTLIDLLKEKSQKGCFQLVMATNDRFIMNRVSLHDWTLIQRSDGRSNIFNYGNSKEIFDEFEYTGLSNFDFFSMDIVKEGFKDATIGEASE